MKKNLTVTIWIITLLSLAIISLILKIYPLIKNINDFKTEEMYNVSIAFYLTPSSKSQSLKIFVPKSNERQKINFRSDNIGLFEDVSNGNKTFASFLVENPSQPEYTFTFAGKSKSFNIPNNFKTEIKKNAEFLEPSKWVQSGDEKIQNLATYLINPKDSDKEALIKIYNYVKKIPSSNSNLSMDALSTMEYPTGNSLGKTRLFVALLRSIGMPSRIITGIELTDANTGNLNTWAEVAIGSNWIPFDVYRHHFGYIPSNYLQLKTGDDAEILDLSRNEVDYSFSINKQIAIPFLNLNPHKFNEEFPISLWGLIENKVIGLWLLSLLVMIPVGGLIVAFLRNVVGLKTFGVFLPVLIAFALMEIGFWQGLFSFIFLIIIVGLVTWPLKDLALMHTPKMVISLSTMVIVMLAGSFIGMSIGWPWLTALSFFPVIILTISAEKFSNLIAEEDLKSALLIFGQTLLSVLICYAVLYKPIVSYIIILFPETLVIVIALAMILGKYIGLRWSELFRFKPLLIFKN